MKEVWQSRIVQLALNRLKSQPIWSSGTPIYSFSLRNLDIRTCFLAYDWDLSNISETELEHLPPRKIFSCVSVTNPLMVIK